MDDSSTFELHPNTLNRSIALPATVGPSEYVSKQMSDRRSVRVARRLSQFDVFAWFRCSSVDVDVALANCAADSSFT